jgi:hypothetical protein
VETVILANEGREDIKQSLIKENTGGLPGAAA